jgi:hypothetical protein
MDDSQNRRHEMFVRVRDFGARFTNDFEAHGLGAQLFAQLGTVVDQLNGHAATKVSSAGQAREGTSTRAEARETLREDLLAINRTAHAMAEDTPGLDDKFRLPRGNNDQNLIDAARAAHADAAPLQAAFISHEMPADFLASLVQHIADLEASMTKQSGGVGTRISANTAIDETISSGMVIVRKLDAVVRNKYRGQPATLAEWTSTSHTERSPKRKASPTTQPSTPPTSQ